MQLKTYVKHLYGKQVNVGGTEYDVDAQGIARNVSDEHGKILLQSLAAWTLHGDHTPPAEAKKPAPEKVEAAEDLEPSAETEDDVLSQVSSLVDEIDTSSDTPTPSKKKKKG